MKFQQPFAYVVVWGVLVGTLFFGARGVDGDHHERAVSELIDVRAQQSEFDEQLLELGSPEGDSGPELLKLFSRLELATASLPSRIDSEFDAETTATLALYMDSLMAVRENVARASALASLQRQVSGAEVTPLGDADVADSVARSQRAEDIRVALGNERFAIAARELGQTCDQLLADYESAFRDDLEAAHYYRLGLYIVTALLLVRLMQSMSESQARTRELRIANRTLEERVEDRTRTLSATNRALESAIAEARRSELDAEAAREAAEAASRTKSSFLANMSHEIRTPMTSILGFSERLLDDDLSELERGDAIATIRRNGEHLTQLVSDILDLSKIEAGKLDLDVVSVSPQRIVEDMRAAMSLRAQTKGLELVVEWSSAAPEFVRTDPLRLEQVLFNLVGNAIKFTDTGRVLVRVGYAPPANSESTGRLHFDIEDTGIGMDQDTIDRLFRPFVQGDSTTTRRFGGTGLGLSICSRLVAGLGGSIHVTSSPDRGSVFSFHVDAGPLTGPLIDTSASDGSTTSVSPATRTRLDGMRILLAEDGEDNQRLLRHLLTSAGALVSVARDGEDAVASAFAARASGRAFDLVLMDMQMPRLDGYEATRRLRAGGYDQPIVALTANAMAPDRERCLAAGCDDYCAKPIRRAVLLEKVARWRIASLEEEVDMKANSKRGAAVQDGELLELVRSFVADLERDMTSMRAALAAMNVERMALLAHRLKGAAGSYGFPEITRQAGLLESALRDGGDPDTLACELASLEALCAAARRA